MAPPVGHQEASSQAGDRLVAGRPATPGLALKEPSTSGVAVRRSRLETERVAAQQGLAVWIAAPGTVS